MDRRPAGLLLASQNAQPSVPRKVRRRSPQTPSRRPTGSFGALSALRAPEAFAAWLRPLFRSDWVVYSKRPFVGAENVLRYLCAYTHRVAISNHRLVALADGYVPFRWRDSAHNNKQRLARLPVAEFLRRFFLHALPPRFVRIRYSDSWLTADAPRSCRAALSC